MREKIKEKYRETQKERERERERGRGKKREGERGERGIYIYMGERDREEKVQSIKWD
jgi:hypothetical protein